MNQNQEDENLEILIDETDADDGASVDDFIRQLEEREKDLHITADTTIIEIAESFEGGELPQFLKQEVEKLRPTVSNAPEERESISNGRTIELESEVSKLTAIVARMELERSEIFKNSQRRAKDFESFKARAERERRETFQSQIGNLAKFLLPALDNFNRAIDSAKSIKEAKSTEFQQLFDGVVLVNEQMYDILGRMGIDTIPTVGEPFDPHFHEAVATENRDDYPNDFVCEELIRGFRIGEKVIRHSMVKVAKNSTTVERSRTEQQSNEEQDNFEPSDHLEDSNS